MLQQIRRIDITSNRWNGFICIKSTKSSVCRFHPHPLKGGYFFTAPSREVGGAAGKPNKYFILS